MNLVSAVEEEFQINLTTTDIMKMRSIAIVKQDVTGKFKLTDAKAQSFILKQDFRNTVIRGKLAAEDCNYQIVKNLRNWFIAIPKATANASIAETNDIDDKDIAPANPTVCQS